MGQKVNPMSLRLPLVKNWSSRWFAGREYAQYLAEDIKLRDALIKKLGTNSAVERIEIERNRDSLTVKIFTARPGVIIGRSGQGINDIKNFIQRQMPTLQPHRKLKVEIAEIKVPELSASLVAQNIGSQITRRIAFRRAAKQAIEKTMAKGAKGIRIGIAGRLGGAEIARTEKFSAGSVPLGNLRADIDYALYHTPTTFGVIGVKVWIHKGERKEEEE